MTTSEAPTVAVIGAGLSGLTCARALVDGGFDVSVFDKGRGPGGRASTRRVSLDGEEVGFDHGAQYFTVRAPVVQNMVESWVCDGVVAPWEGRIAVLGPRGEVESYNEKPRFVGQPGMNRLGVHLADGLKVQCGVHVDEIQRALDGIRLLDRDGNTLGVFRTVVSTAPPAQTTSLLSKVSPKLANRTAGVEMNPCWAVMAAFATPLGVPYDGAFINEGALSWIARTSSKPGRLAAPDRWVFHASPAWSKEHLEIEREEAASLLLDAAARAMGLDVLHPSHIEAHRWRYAIAENPIDAGALFDSEAGVGACGDWTSGNRIEGAILAGLDMARLVGELGLR
jgi:predicted NAD/FAD-dependent oxidoreductase